MGNMAAPGLVTCDVPMELLRRSERPHVWRQAVAVMLQLHIRRLQDPAESGIVLVLGCTDWQRNMLRAELRRLIPELAQVTTAYNIINNTLQNQFLYLLCLSV